MSEPAWVKEKAALDSMNDGHGPHMHWCLDTPKEAKLKRQAWDDFVEWANLWLGQGFSLACDDGHILDQVTNWTFKGFLAGRGIHR